MLSASRTLLLRAAPAPKSSLMVMQGAARRHASNAMQQHQHHYCGPTVSGWTTSQNAYHTLYLNNLKRWRKNFWRLYARRMIQLAAISAAAMSLRQKASKLEKMASKQDIEKPKQWQNWQQANWEETALESVGNSSIKRWWMATKRLMALGVLVSPLTVLVPLSYVSPKAQEMTWSYALWGIEQAGPTWIKLVQWATTRQDLFSPQFCQYFGKLRDNTVGHSWEETKRILQDEFIDDEDMAKLLERERNPFQTSSSVQKRSTMKSITATNDPQHRQPSSWEEFLKLDPEPIGSGCIAQVYQGRLLKPTPQYPVNTKVAVKVQHPGIWHKVCVDFYILGKCAKFLEALPYLNLRMLSLSDTVRQFRDIMVPQLDLTLEAKHLSRFNADFSSDASIGFPKPLDELTTSQVLVETFIEGTPILEYVNSSQPERKQLAQLGLKSTLKMIFLHDFVHGDLHPGNILISGEYPNLKMNMLDCGLVLEMGPSQHVNLVKVMGAFTRRDGRLAGQLMIDLKAQERHHDFLMAGAGNNTMLMGGSDENSVAYQQEQAQILQRAEDDVQAFIHGIERICIMDEGQNFIEHVGDYITDICTLACRHHVKLEAAFINAALAVEIMEGIAAALYPQLRVQQVALPLIVQAEFMHRLGLH